jgi:hypothetical protein
VQTPTYIIDRTLKRPRDAIAFLNKILSAAEGQNLPLTSRAVLSVEPSYCRERVNNLIREWQACHPLIKLYLDAIAGNARLTVSDLGEEQLALIALEALSISRPPADEIERIALKVFEKNKEAAIGKLAQELTACLFKVGAVALKLHPDVPYKCCYEEHSTIQAAEITLDAKIMLHPMVAPALGGSTDRGPAAENAETASAA